MDINRKLRIISMIDRLSPDQMEETETVLYKVVSGEPLTDAERAANPELWARAEGAGFHFKRE